MCGHFCPFPTEILSCFFLLGVRVFVLVARVHATDLIHGREGIVAKNMAVTSS